MGVVGEVGDDLVAEGVVVGIAGKGQPGQAAVARGGEQLERLPAFTPGGCRLFGRLEDREVSPPLGEEVAHR